MKAFLKAGVLGEDGVLRDNDTGTPQGGILSPVLANVALSVLDEHLAQHPGGPHSAAWHRQSRCQRGQPISPRAVRRRLADPGRQGLREEAAAVLANTAGAP